jgi:hypothetical protein
MGSEKPPAPGPLNLTLKKGLGEFKEVSLPNLNTKLKVRPSDVDTNHQI